MNNFEELVEVKCVSNSEKFAYLQKYKSGNEREIVDTYKSLASAVAFTSAKTSLKREYDDEQKLFNYYTKVIHDLPLLSYDDIDGIRNFSTYLSRCKNCMESSSTGNLLDSPQHVKIIFKKLPYKMRDRFRRLAYDIQSSNRLIAFETILLFSE